MSEHPMSGDYCVLVDCVEHPYVLEASDGSGFARNALRFPDAESAARWGVDLSGRWLGLRAYRVLDTRDGSVEREVIV